MESSPIPATKNKFDKQDIILIVCYLVIYRLFGLFPGTIISLTTYSPIKKLFNNGSITKNQKIKKLLVWVSIGLAAGVAALLAQTYLIFYVFGPAYPSACKLGSKEFVDKCFQNVAIKNKSPIYCAKMSRITGAFDSQDTCYSNLAELTSNSSLCEKITLLNGIGSKNTCYHNIGAALGDANICKQITGAVRDRDGILLDTNYCIMLVAINKLDSDLCPSITVTTTSYTDENASQTRCYAELGVRLKNRSLCEKSGEFRSDCLGSIQ
jgi:hypothetical protein